MFQGNCIKAPKYDGKQDGQRRILIKAGHPVLAALGCVQQQIQAPRRGGWRLGCVGAHEKIVEASSGEFNVGAFSDQDSAEDLERRWTIENASS